MTTKIEWTDETWNPITGCTHAGSPGCDNCYARRFAGRHLGVWGDQSDASNPERGFRQFSDIQLHEDRLSLPLRWRKPRRIFVNSMGDLFHPGVPFEWVDSVLAVVALCPQHTFQVLTKRPERMVEYFAGWPWDTKRLLAALSVSTKESIHQKIGRFDTEFPLPNLWLGVTAEDQARADERIQLLLQTPAAVRFVSVEPMLGAVDLRNMMCGEGRLDALLGWKPDVGPEGANTSSLDWVIAGGETGPGARPCHPDWVRGLRDQCQEAGVAFFFKSFGEWVDRRILGRGPVMGEQWGTLDLQGNFYPTATPWNGKTGEDSDAGEVVMIRVGKAGAGRRLDGREWSEFPEVTA